MAGREDREKPCVRGEGCAADEGRRVSSLGETDGKRKIEYDKVLPILCRTNPKCGIRLICRLVSKVNINTEYLVLLRYGS